MGALVGGVCHGHCCHQLVQIMAALIHGGSRGNCSMGAAMAWLVLCHVGGDIFAEMSEGGLGEPDIIVYRYRIHVSSSVGLWGDCQGQRPPS